MLASTFGELCRDLVGTLWRCVSIFFATLQWIATPAPEEDSYFKRVGSPHMDLVTQQEDLIWLLYHVGIGVVYQWFAMYQGAICISFDQVCFYLTSLKSWWNWHMALSPFLLSSWLLFGWVCLRWSHDQIYCKKAELLVKEVSQWHQLELKLLCCCGYRAETFDF